MVINKSMSNFFKDKNGKVVIGQSPNAPLWIAIVLWICVYIPIPVVQSFAKLAVIPVMLYWSYLEVFFGVNTFRKLLGIVVTIYYINKIWVMFL